MHVRHAVSEKLIEDRKHLSAATGRPVLYTGVQKVICASPDIELCLCQVAELQLL